MFCGKGRGMVAVGGGDLGKMVAMAGQKSMPLEGMGAASMNAYASFQGRAINGGAKAQPRSHMAGEAATTTGSTG
jgi:hypothetical protein